MQSRKCNTVNALHCTQVGYCMKFSFNQYTKFEVDIFPERVAIIYQICTVPKMYYFVVVSHAETISKFLVSPQMHEKNQFCTVAQKCIQMHFLRHHSADSADLSNLLSHHCHHSSSVIRYNTHNAKLTILMKWSTVVITRIWNWETDIAPHPRRVSQWMWMWESQSIISNEPFISSFAKSFRCWVAKHAVARRGHKIF